MKNHNYSYEENPEELKSQKSFKFNWWHMSLIILAIIAVTAVIVLPKFKPIIKQEGTIEIPQDQSNKSPVDTSGLIPSVVFNDTAGKKP